MLDVIGWQQPGFDQVGNRNFKRWVQCSAIAQLQEVDDEFAVHQPAAQQLCIKWPASWLMLRHLIAHIEHFCSQTGGFARAAKHFVNGSLDIGPRFWRPI